jgi:phosphatidate cytidylyltransferase
VPDWRDDEPRDDWAEPEPRPGEGVRVVGPDGNPGRPPVPPQRAPGRFPLPEDSGSGWSAEPPPEPRRRGGRDPSSGSVQLPHWTDPPTGEVPRLGGGSADDDYESWSSFTGPGTRFRGDSSDWNAGDFTHGELAQDDNTMIGALSDHDEHEEVRGPPRRRGGGGGRRGRHGPRPEGEGPGGSLEGAPEYEPIESGDDRSPGDLNRRVITGAVLAVVALVAFAAGRPVATFLVTVIVGVAAFELFDAFRRAGYHTAVPMGLLGCIAIVPIAYSQGERAFPLVGVLVITFSMLWYLFEVVHQRPTVNIGLTMLVFGYVGVLGGFAGLLLAPNPGGTGLLGGVVICAIGSDIVAYFAGRSFGNTKLMPRISPHKTVEGLIAGAIAAIVLGGLVGALVHPWATKGIGAGLALGIIVAVTAPLGDLVESMLKRDLHVKDLGVILPGHGGILDRFDAMLFALPAAYYLVLYLFSH